MLDVGMGTFIILNFLILILVIVHDYIKQKT